MSCEKDLVDVCTPKTLHEAVVETPKVEPQDFTTCIPFGATISQKDGIVSFEAGKIIPDGVYSTFTVKDNCIIAVGNLEIPTYTASPCIPIPQPCDCGEGGSVTISTKSGNLLSQDGSGALFAGLTVTGNGVTITGNGTPNKPLVITASSSSAGSLSITAGNDGVIVTGSGSTTDPVTVSHKVQGNTQRINGMAFDRFGHLTDYEEPSTSKGIKGIIASDGIQATTDASKGIVTIGLANAMLPLSQTLLGGYNVAFDNHNIPISITREITVPEDTYQLGDYKVTINGFGSITEIKESPVVPKTSVLRTMAVAAPVVTTAYGRKISVASDREQITFQIEIESYFRIEIDSTTEMKEVVVLVDGEALAGHLCGPYRYVGLSVAIYAVSTHTIEFIGAFAPNTYFTVTLVQK